MTPLLLCIIGGTALFLGVAIGATGIGGVLLVPFLSLLAGIDLRRAIAAALLSFVPGCVVAVVLHARRGHFPWRDAALLCATAAPASWLGALAAHAAPTRLIQAAVGALLLAGGWHALRGRAAAIVGGRRLPAAVLLTLGGGTGLVSAMTGAGGAFVLLPILMLLDTPILPAIGLGQMIAIPIAGVASVANWRAGLIDTTLAAGLAVALSLGIAVGTPIAHALPQVILRRVLGVLVVLAGTAMVMRTVVDALAAAG